MYAGQPVSDDALSAAPGSKRNGEPGGSPEHSRPRMEEDAGLGFPWEASPLPIGNFTAPPSFGIGAAPLPPPPGLTGKHADMDVLTNLLQQQLANHIQLQHTVQLLAAMHSSSASSSSPAATSTPSIPKVDQQKATSTKFELSSRLSASINSEGAKIRRELHKIAAAHAHIERLTQQVDSLRTGRLPAQCRPFKLPFLAEEWEQAVGNANLDDVVVPAPAGESLEFVSEKLHVEYLASNAIICIVVETRRLERLRTNSSEEHFAQTSLALAAKEREVFSKTGSGITVTNEYWSEFEQVIRLAANKVYIEQVRKVSSEALVLEDRKAKQRARELEALEKAALLPKEDIFRKGIEEVLKQKKKSKQLPAHLEKLVKVSDLLMMDVHDVSEAAIRKEPETAKPANGSKNGSTPAGGRGQSQKKKQAKQGGKGSGKGKNSNENSNNKGKGKGKVTDKGKGKGKGNQKSDQKGKDGNKGQSKGAKHGGKSTKK